MESEPRETGPAAAGEGGGGGGWDSAARRSDVGPAEPMYRTKVVEFLGRTTSIIMQNENGPCPLLAICNVLLLRNALQLGFDGAEVSQEKLLSLIAERLLDSNSHTQGTDAMYADNQSQNIADAIDLLPRLATGLDVNVLFRKINDFEFTRECAIFDLLDIALYHGWIVDPQDAETAAAIGSKSYNTIAAELALVQSRLEGQQSNIDEEPVDFAAAATAALGVPSPSLSRGLSFDATPLLNNGRKKRGDLEEQEELNRALNLSAVEISEPVQVSEPLNFSFLSGASQSPNIELTNGANTPGIETNADSPRLTLLDESGLTELDNVTCSVSQVGSEEQAPVECSDSNENVIQENKNHFEKTTEAIVENNNDATVKNSQDTEQSEEESHGQHTNSEVSQKTSDSVTDQEQTSFDLQHSGSNAVFGVEEEHVYSELCGAMNNLEVNEPIYQGEEHVLNSSQMPYENTEPVYEGEIKLNEQSNITEKGLSNDTNDNTAHHQLQIIDNFLKINASQLTIYGLFSLQEGLKERELCVFFRNNHFNTMFKYNGELYLLVTDQGYIHQTDLVWEKLNEVNGDTVYMTGNFTRFKAADQGADSWSVRDAVNSTTDYLSKLGVPSSPNEAMNSDLQLAIALQQQELDHQPQRNQQQSHQQQRLQQHMWQQQSQYPGRSPPPGQPGLVVGPTASPGHPRMLSKSDSKSSKDRCSVM